jgi:CII-binding regulator of phage lambda lysogenization HflD
MIYICNSIKKNLYFFLFKTRHENIRLKNQLKKRELQLKSKEELAEGLHMIDFEQLKIENQTYSEKIEERNEVKINKFSFYISSFLFLAKELMKLRKKISTTVQILSHIKEKLNFVGDQREQAAKTLAEKEQEVKQVYIKLILLICIPIQIFSFSFCQYL